MNRSVCSLLVLFSASFYTSAMEASELNRTTLTNSSLLMEDDNSTLLLNETATQAESILIRLRKHVAEDFVFIENAFNDVIRKVEEESSSELVLVAVVGALSALLTTLLLCCLRLFICRCLSLRRRRLIRRLSHEVASHEKLVPHPVDSDGDE